MHPEATWNIRLNRPWLAGRPATPNSLNCDTCDLIAAREGVG
jgi:hypothetical protein